MVLYFGLSTDMKNGRNPQIKFAHNTIFIYKLYCEMQKLDKNQVLDETRRVWLKLGENLATGVLKVFLSNILFDKNSHLNLLTMLLKGLVSMGPTP